MGNKVCGSIFIPCSKTSIVTGEWENKVRCAVVACIFTSLKSSFG